MKNNLKIELMNFINIKLEEKEMILKWRNHPDIRKWMYNQDEIKLEEHLGFIDSLKSRKDKLYFLVKKEDEFIGVIYFTQLVNKEIVHMGIYGNPNIKGNGKILLNKIIDYSFNNLKVKRVFSEVFAENEKAYNLYEKFNFKDISEKTVNNKKVICMELENDNNKESLCVK
ncbi:UDP-4-amino-4,6-dideoxy-N-acetyl-beta-L-altrosamine N-acetyltransferase [Aliarcobacter cryaerophilus]|uniref:UDP-4-amino-4, 6-dideoxy-N-acetyl-beta-L-altrosamine N-acetyltransferase n=1 Tax=Aliarcobacter cryaerophilus TaxID=28198 RepID=UPI003DA5F8B0